MVVNYQLGELVMVVNYHDYQEYCRLLARFKSNYQLGELVMVANYHDYHEFLRLLAHLKSNYQLGELVMVANYQVIIIILSSAGTS